MNLIFFFFNLLCVYMCILSFFSVSLTDTTSLVDVPVSPFPYVNFPKVLLLYRLKYY